MKILVVGSGGREHALAWKLALSEDVSEVIVSPGNGGTQGVAGQGKIKSGMQGVAWQDKIKNHSFGKPLVAPFSDLVHFVKEEKIDLVVVGSEEFLSQGISNIITQAGIACFGPSKEAACLETSKVFAKKMMEVAGIPTARYRLFEKNDLEEAKRYVRAHKHPLVVKADGLCAGKGVMLSSDYAFSTQALDVFFRFQSFGQAAEKVLVEEFLEGEEVSVLAFCDGANVRLLPPMQDHKRIGEGDVGPNTGGMGVYSHPSFLSESDMEEIKQKIFLPILAAMQERKIVYRGLLYAGLIFHKKKFYVLEFNARFGDPECQCVLPLLQSDLLPLLLASTKGDLSKVDFELKNSKAVNVVLASGGYPGMFEKGLPIEGLDKVTSNTTYAFHAGTKYVDGKLVSNGGRVLSLTSIAPSFLEARQRVYEDMKKIHLQNGYYRKDIAYREMKRLKSF